MAASNDAVQRNFLLPIEQAEWLRAYAFRTRRHQAEVVREALSEYQARAERASSAGARESNRALVERFSGGHGIDLAVLRDEHGQMWDDDR